MAKKQTKSVSTVSANLPSWQSIAKNKKSIPITFNNETLFTIEELSVEQFETFMQKIELEKTDKPNKSGKNKKDSISDINQILNEEENLADILKLMVKGVSFEGQTNSEILITMNSFSTSISGQVNDALQELLISNMIKHMNNISNAIDTFETTNKIEQKIQKLTDFSK